MDNVYVEMATQASVVQDEAPEIFETDSEEIVALKNTPLWRFDFSLVDEAPCSAMGEHAPTVEEAIPLVAERLRLLVVEE